ncbi:FAD-dependent monooxygenase [Pelagibacterium xiamenense]|uniref:FAD-dependent monooxygenase n=1 Tax=Pelagibacterium xiamenense TaxID=2901140 RepID=UPI001E5A8F78|nr:FAD-dependent monooxygenase [Pelagibacterium xiamenense]MCD7059930.1 FAD-dependent monooxygenase [Pelagibacterium xiamenense]
MGTQRTVYIAGAGIAGLTLALALAKFGTRVVVIERNAQIAEFGAGLQISPNARHALDALGLTDALSEKSFEPEGIDIYPDGRTEPLQTLTLGKIATARYGAPYVVMHRADLAEVLAAAARRFANIEIVFGVENFAVTQKDKGVAVTFTEAGSIDRKGTGFAFVGADGVNSATRTNVLGGPAAVYSGKIAWRTLVPPAALSGLLDLGRTSILMGAHHHLVVYPLPHRDAVNLALFTDARERDLDAAMLRQTPGLKAGPDRRLATILERAGETWTPWVLSTVRTPLWHEGPVGIIGDAAHAMLPFQAQGAAMGIEDAAILAPLLASSPDAGHAFTRFLALRRERVDKVQALSAANGRIFHMRWPATLARNAVIRAQGPLGHFRRLDWLYGYRTHTDPKS